MFTFNTVGALMLNVATRQPVTQKTAPAANRSKR